MQSKRVNDGFLLRLEKGEEIISSITRFSKENNIIAAHIHAIGAVSAVELGFYHLDKKEYRFKKINRNLEISSMTGNISLFENEQTIHAHGIFSDENYSCMGGHVTNATVSATCEIYLTNFNSPLVRKTNEDIGLKLLDLE